MKLIEDKNKIVVGINNISKFFILKVLIKFIFNLDHRRI